MCCDGVLEQSLFRAERDEPGVTFDTSSRCSPSGKDQSESACHVAPWQHAECSRSGEDDDAGNVATTRERTIVPEAIEIVNLSPLGKRTGVPVGRCRRAGARTLLTLRHRYENIRSYRMSKRELPFAFQRTPASLIAFGSTSAQNLPRSPFPRKHLLAADNRSISFLVGVTR